MSEGVSFQELRKSICLLLETVSKACRQKERLHSLKSRLIDAIEKETKKPLFLRDFLFLNKNCENILELLQIDRDVDETLNKAEKKLESLYTRVKLIEELLSERKQHLAELDALREENAALKEELEQAQDNIPYTLWLEVCAMRREGKTDNEIAATLYDKGQGLSKSQLGALLYTGNETRPASTTLQDWGTRLFR